MKHKKVLRAAAAGLTLALALSACASSTANAPAAGADTTTAAAAAADTTTAATAADSSINAQLNGYNGTDDKTPVTFTFWNYDGTKDTPYTDDVAKEIQRLTGVTLQISYPVNGQAENTVATMVASGDMPDIIYAKGDTSKFYDAGYIVKLDDYLDKEGQNIKDVYGDYMKRLRYSPDDPHYYTLGAYGVGSPIWNVVSPLPIQNAVLKDQGYPEVKTMDEAEQVIKAYIQKYPEINGQKTIGLSLLADDWRWLISVGNPSGFAAGFPDNGEWIMQLDGTAQYKFLNPKLEDWYRWLNKLNAEGLLDPDSFTQKYDQYTAKLTSGRVLAIADAGWEFSDAEKALLAANMPERTYALMPVTIDADTKSAMMTDFGYSAGWGVFISTKCKDPERAFQFLNWLASDYAQVLNNWGIEGKDYDYVNGKRVWRPDILQMSLTDTDFGLKTGIGLYGYPFPQRGDGVADPTGSNYTTNTQQSIIDNYNSAAKETLAAYNVQMWKDLYPPTSDFPVSPFGAAWQINIPSDSQLNITVTNADKYCQTALPALILMDPSQFDAGWDKIQSDLKDLGIDQANADMTKMAQDKIAFWK